MRLHKRTFSKESFAGPELCPSCLKRLSADATSSRLALKKITCITLSSQAAKADTRLHMHAFSAEHFVGLELFSKVISKRHLDSNCEHKRGAEKNNVHFLLVKRRLMIISTATHTNTRTGTKASTRLYRSEHFPLCSREGSFETAQGRVILPLVALPQVNLCRFVRSYVK